MFWDSLDTRILRTKWKYWSDKLQIPFEKAPVNKPIYHELEPLKNAVSTPHTLLKALIMLTHTHVFLW